MKGVRQTKAGVVRCRLRRTRFSSARATMAVDKPIVPLENLEMYERAGLILRSIILSSDADSSCDTPLPLAFYLPVAGCHRT
jgi:hypothetical protein